MSGNTPSQARMRVIIDNDFGGDPDGLFQLAHHVLSPSVDIRGIIGARMYPGGFYGQPATAAFSCELAQRLLDKMGRGADFKVVPGAEEPMEKHWVPQPSPGAELIVREAMRDDAEGPLYVACGAGLTNIASAYIMERRIAERLTVIWIGGAEHAGTRLPPPGASDLEYNLGMDVVSGQAVFTDSSLKLWQVPRDVYRQTLISRAELSRRMALGGPVGQYLMDCLEVVFQGAGKALGETYILGDSPLVLLTALQSCWEWDPSSCQYFYKRRPALDENGAYLEMTGSPPMRLYTHLDVRLMFEDFFAKIAALGDAETA